MRYVLAHIGTAVLITTIWFLVLWLGSDFIVDLFESRDLGIIVCFVFGFILGYPIVGSYYVAHSAVSDWTFEHEYPKGK